MTTGLDRSQYKERYFEDERYNAGVDDFENEYSLRHSKHGLYFETIRIQKIFEVLNEERITFSGKRILDVGCNYGFYSLLFAYLKRDSNQITGIDFLENSIETAKRINGSIHFTQQDLYEPLDYPEKSFDFILINYVLNCITEKREDVIKQLGSRVAVGGHILFFDFFGDYTHNLIYYLEGLIQFKNPFRYSKNKINKKMEMSRHPSISIEEIKKVLPNFKIIGYNKMNPVKQKGLLIKKIINKIYPKYQIAKYAVILIKRIN